MPRRKPLASPPADRHDTVLPLPTEVHSNAWAVDASCIGNPGDTEYQCIDLATGERVFHYGPFFGTNNIGEFLAIVHAVALMAQRGITDKVVYSDSTSAIAWVRNKKCKTLLAESADTAKAFALLRRAQTWLRTHSVATPVIKWETHRWGEIPADFGRKK